jgi:putative transposase
MLKSKPKGYRFPVEIISFVVWSYHRFNDSYRDIKERLLYRGISVSHETARNWCIRFGAHFHDVIKKREARPADKWHLDEMLVTVNGEKFWLWRAVDKNGYELDVFLQKRRNKRAAIRFLSRLLGSYPKPRVIVTDKLKSYIKPVRHMCHGTEHRQHKGLNNQVENAHQPTRRKETCLVRFKSPAGVQKMLSLMGKTRNIFAVDVGRYTNPASLQREKFQEAKAIWDSAAHMLLCA